MTRISNERNFTKIIAHRHHERGVDLTAVQKLKSVGLIHSIQVNVNVLTIDNKYTVSTDDGL